MSRIDNVDSCPACQGCRLWAWEVAEGDHWARFRCLLCGLHFQVMTDAGELADQEFHAERDRHYRRHGWHPDLTDDEVFALLKRARPLHFRVKRAYREIRRRLEPPDIWRAYIDNGLYLEDVR